MIVSIDFELRVFCECSEEKHSIHPFFFLLFSAAESKSLKIILSFAVGCLLGDVFLNSLPKVWSCDRMNNTGGMTGALWVLCGVLLFTIIEKIFSSCTNDDRKPQNNTPDTNDAQNGLVIDRKSGTQPIKIAGYLNLMANSIDNFTQGLAVAASFLVSFRQGLFGTIVILCEFNFARLISLFSYNTDE